MKTLALLSGGIDSALTAYLAKDMGEVVPLFVDYRQTIEELIAAGDIAEWLNCKMITTRVGMPKSASPTGTNYIPGRNLVFLSLATAAAMNNGCEYIAIGANKDDFTDYPDCRLEFITQFERIIQSYASLKLYAPLVHYTKKEIIAWGYHKGLPFERTWTCYDPQDLRACGRCNACKLRLEGFEALGVKDPQKYV